MTNSHFGLLYVCNGDNARAPLAAACTRATTTTNDYGVSWTIDSAGTETAAGSGVRPEAVRAGAIVDAALADHAPSLLTADHCDGPDLILAMSWDQVSQIWSLVPGAWEKVFTIKEFIHWAKKAPARPPILFADRAEQMRDKIVQAHAIRKRARADYGFWGGIRPQDLNLIEPIGKGDEAWTTLANAVHALTSDVVTLLAGPEIKPAAKRAPKKNAKKAAPGHRSPRGAGRSKAKARR